MIWQFCCRCCCCWEFYLVTNKIFVNLIRCTKSFVYSFSLTHTHTHINFVKIVHYYWWININYHLSDWNYWKISFHYCHCHQYCCCCCCCCCLFVLFVIDDHHLWFLFYCCFWRMFVNQVFSALNFFWNEWSIYH